MMDFGSDSSDEGNSSANDGLDDDEIDPELSDEELFEQEFLMHKRDYYINKLKYPEMTKYVSVESVNLMRSLRF